MINYLVTQMKTNCQTKIQLRISSFPTNSILSFQRLTTSSFSPAHQETTEKKEYFPSFFIDNSILECRVVDLPVISNFPNSVHEEWNTQTKTYTVLKSTDAYLLVYDPSVPSSFTFLKTLRDQIAMARGLGEIPMVVVANKTDMVDQSDEKDFSIKVKKHWKLKHVECSAKYNWNVHEVFKELGTEILSVRRGENVNYVKQEKRKICGLCIEISTVDRLRNV